MNKYILNEEGNPVLCEDTITWVNSVSKNSIIVQNTIDNQFISTVFLGFDHSYSGGPPILFETMIFGGPHDQYQTRYSTKAEALAGHQEAIDLVKGA